MNCNRMEDVILDLAGGAQPSPEAASHLRECRPCAARLDDVRATMSLLDAWEVPEPSPFFDTRLKARMREAEAAPQQGWLAGWLRKPALALSMAAALAIGVTYYTFGPQRVHPATTTVVSNEIFEAQPGSAVGDLQALDTTEDIIGMVHDDDSAEDIYLF